MAQSAAATNVLVLSDRADSLFVRIWYYSDTAVDEVDALKVNVETLNYRTFNLITDGSVANVTRNGFVPGELLTDQANTALQAYVVDWQPTANTLIVVGLTANADLTTYFGNGDVLKGQLSNSTITLKASASTVVPPRLLTIESIAWQVGSGAVELEWKGNNAFTTATFLFGSSYSGRNALESVIPNNAASVINGNLYISTHGITAKSGYSLTMELSKGIGFAERSTY